MPSNRECDICGASGVGVIRPIILMPEDAVVFLGIAEPGERGACPECCSRHKIEHRIVVRNNDDGQALHDHPWWGLSFVLYGGYFERWVDPRPGQVPWQYCLWWAPGSVIFRSAVHRHRITLREGKPCWTLFVTGPRVREWGFWCPQGFVHWRDFTKPGDYGQVGKGCDQ